MAYKAWNQNQWNARDVSAGALTNAVLKATPGAGQRHYITDIVICGGATAGVWMLRDGSGGTILFQIYVTANALPQIVHLEVPIKCSDNTALCVTNAGASTNGAIFVNGFTDK